MNSPRSEKSVSVVKNVALLTTSSPRLFRTPSVAVSFGFLHQPVDELGADAIIDHYDEFIPTLERIACL